MFSKGKFSSQKNSRSPVRFYVRYSRYSLASRAFSKAKKFCDMCRIPNWSHFKLSIMNEMFNFLLF